MLRAKDLVHCGFWLTTEQYQAIPAVLEGIWPEVDAHEYQDPEWGDTLTGWSVRATDGHFFVSPGFNASKRMFAVTVSFSPELAKDALLFIKAVLDMGCQPFDEDVVARVKAVVESS